MNGYPPSTFSGCYFTLFVAKSLFTSQSAQPWESICPHAVARNGNIKVNIPSSMLGVQ